MRFCHSTRLPGHVYEFTNCFMPTDNQFVRKNMKSNSLQFGGLRHLGVRSHSRKAWGTNKLVATSWKQSYFRGEVCEAVCANCLHDSEHDFDVMSFKRVPTISCGGCRGEVRSRRDFFGMGFWDVSMPKDLTRRSSFSRNTHRIYSAKATLFHEQPAVVTTNQLSDGLIRVVILKYRISAVTCNPR